MPVLLAIIKIVAVLLAILVLLIVTALLLPLGFSFDYHLGRFRVEAIYGPLRRTVWAHRSGHQRHAKAETPKAEVAVPKRVVPETPPSAEKQPKKPKAEASASQQVLPTGEFVPPIQEGLPPDEEEAELPSGARSRLERVLDLLEEDPKALANCVLAHMRWLDRHSLFKIKVRHLHVYWTVTCEDASRTAIVYGAEMAAFNTALSLAQQVIRLQSDVLWLEPDFTGEHRAKRKVSFVVSASAILMIHLLYRVWKDPLLQPAAQAEPQTN